MKRAEYWGYVAVSFFILFFIGFATAWDGYISSGEEAMTAFMQSVWVIFAWVIGYRRIKDAGHHGAWAFFTPFLIGLIIIGCLGSHESKYGSTL